MSILFINATLDVSQCGVHLHMMDAIDVFWTSFECQSALLKLFGLLKCRKSDTQSSIDILSHSINLMQFSNLSLPQMSPLQLLITTKLESSIIS